jgi:hypothetical protein
MFGEPGEGNFSLDESWTEDIPQVSDEENAHFTAPYSKDGVLKRRFFKWNTTKP